VSDAARALSVVPGRLAVCRLEPDAPIPAWLFHAEAQFFSLTRTPAETSVVCFEDDLPPSVTRAERGWRALEIEGPIPFAETGVLAGVVAPLAESKLSVFALSTFDTDYVLVREADLPRAIEALRARHVVREG
jgi:hypothetical protein